MNEAAASIIRVCVVDDHALVRETVSRYLDSEPDIQVAAKCASVEETLQVLASTPVDVLLLDVNLGGTERGSAVLEKLPQMNFSGKVLVVAAVVTDMEALRLLGHGVAGIVIKTSPPDVLARAIRKVAVGEMWFDQRYLQLFLRQTATLLKDNPTLEFTGREQEVMRSIAAGLTNKEIAARLGVRETTVKGIIQHLFHRTGVKSRAQLVQFSQEE